MAHFSRGNSCVTSSDDDDLEDEAIGCGVEIAFEELVGFLRVSGIN